MIRRPPRSTLDRSSAASDVYKRQGIKTTYKTFESFATKVAKYLPKADGKILITRITTVSYTHLRAHETVLDLVCRLLLEKKKKYTKYIQSILNSTKNDKTHEHQQIKYIGIIKTISVP